MRNHDIKIILVLLALLVTLGLLLGGQKIYQARMIERPVVTRLLTLHYVDEAALVNSKGMNTLQVHIKQAGNLKQKYQEIDQIMADQYAKRNYEIDISDRRDPFLQKQLDKLELALYEAIAQNRYMELEQRFAAAAGKGDFEYQLQIDQQKLYVQISRGDKFLYEIIDRHNPDIVSVNNGV